MRAKFEKMIRAKQNEICAAIAELDGTQFQEDCWTRPGGGGGISRVLQNGKARRAAQRGRACVRVQLLSGALTLSRAAQVFEKAGVNVSVVYGTMPPEAYRAATGDSSKVRRRCACESVSHAPFQAVNAGPVPFFAAGISSVMHPLNPMAPTMHFNYRYFETDPPSGVEGAPRAWWFGGGTDLTPSYLFPEDVQHFHGTYKGVCDQHDPAFYPKFKAWCDDYFLIKHRGERRGLGGIFFDDMNDRDADKILAFSTACAGAVVPAYVPLVAKHKDDGFTEAQREWQQLRRGRCVLCVAVARARLCCALTRGGLAAHTATSSSTWFMVRLAAPRAPALPLRVLTLARCPLPPPQTAAPRLGSRRAGASRASSCRCPSRRAGSTTSSRHPAAGSGTSWTPAAPRATGCRRRVSCAPTRRVLSARIRAKRCSGCQQRACGGCQQEDRSARVPERGKLEPPPPLFASPLTLPAHTPGTAHGCNCPQWAVRRASPLSVRLLPPRPPSSCAPLLLGTCLSRAKPPSASTRTHSWWRRRPRRRVGNRLRFGTGLPFFPWRRCRRPWEPACPAGGDAAVPCGHVLACVNSLSVRVGCCSYEGRALSAPLRGRPRLCGWCQLAGSLLGRCA